MNKVTKQVLIACVTAQVLVPLSAVQAAIFHVAPGGNDAYAGSEAAPLRTIQRAADLAQPGDVITVREGVYRERINPPRGGESAQHRIVFQAAPGEKVAIKGSEVVKDWVNVQGDAWRVTLANSFFGDFNPYRDLIHGDWFNPLGRQHHTGAVYLNGDWLTEATQLDDVLQPVGVTPLWFGQVDQDHTTIWAQFPGVNPNEQLVEINVRRAVFYPAQPGVNYITVRGFTLCQAATPWAPPTAEQIGLIGTHWSKGWIIENNVISHSTCAGISLGKYGDEWDNTSAETAEGYVKTIQRGLQNGWNKETIGHHIVRHNTISHCEQAGIVGSLGAIFSIVSDNVIHDIHVRRQFSGAEMAGIKIHAAIDVTIRNNHIYRTCRGLWLDWMAQGTRVSQNLFHDNTSEDLFVEVNHGPFLVDNNLFLSEVALRDVSQGGAYVHNLLTGRIISQPELARSTPYHPPHATSLAGLRNIKGGDNRFYNNILVGAGKSSDVTVNPVGRDPQRADGYGLWVYDTREYPSQLQGNVYYNGARPHSEEVSHALQVDAEPRISIVQEGRNVNLHVTLGQALRESKTSIVTAAVLGQTKVSGVPFENADGSPLTIDADYFGKKRNAAGPTAGPFENPGVGPLTLKVW